MTVKHVCGRSEGCMCMYDPELNDELKAIHLVTLDEDAIERAQEALCRFLFPGYVVPRSEMIEAVIRALAGGDDWRAKLPARRAAIGRPNAQPDRELLTACRDVVGNYMGGDDIAESIAELERLTGGQQGG